MAQCGPKFFRRNWQIVLFHEVNQCVCRCIVTWDLLDLLGTGHMLSSSTQSIQPIFCERLFCTCLRIRYWLKVSHRLGTAWNWNTRAMKAFEKKCFNASADFFVETRTPPLYMIWLSPKVNQNHSAKQWFSSRANNKQAVPPICEGRNVWYSMLLAPSTKAIMLKKRWSYQTVLLGTRKI